jgi:hypothetical protein
MNWLKRLFKREDDYIIHRNEVPMSTIIRWYLYDTGNDENEIAELIGLTPISQEGMDKEQEDSDLRLSQLEFILPFITSMAEINSKTIATIAVQLAHEDGAEMEQGIDETITVLEGLYKTVSMASLVGAFSIALNLGLIKQGALSSGPERMEDISDE